MQRALMIDARESEAQPTAQEGVRAQVAVRLDVLFVLNNLKLGGSERKVLRLVERLHHIGIHAGIACLNGPYPLATTLPHTVALFKLERRGPFSPAAVWRLRRLVLAHRPATLVSVNLYPSLYVLACAALLASPRPRTVGLINTATYVTSGLRRLLYQRLLPLLHATVHGSQTQRASWFQADAPAAQRSTVIYNGVDLAKFAPGTTAGQAQLLRAQLGIPPGRFVIASVGRLAPEKNQTLLIDALQRMHSSGVDAHLVLAGDGPLRESLRAQAVDKGVGSRVSFTGAIDDVRPVLDLMDVFVLPSVETFSNAALEAMAMGKPVVLNARGGAPEMVDDGVEGYVIAPTELGARLPAVLAALCAEPRRRAQLGLAARQRMERSFSMDAMVARYVGLLSAKSPEESHV